VSRYLLWSLAMFVVAGTGLAHAASAPDPIEGKWYGKAGYLNDRVDLGCEFKRDDAGALRLALYGSVFSSYGLVVPGGLALESDGTLLGKKPFTLHRVDRVPRPSCTAGRRNIVMRLWIAAAGPGK